VFQDLDKGDVKLQDKEKGEDLIVHDNVNSLVETSGSKGLVDQDGAKQNGSGLVSAIAGITNKVSGSGNGVHKSHSADEFIGANIGNLNNEFWKQNTNV
jgi:hypothetical protein